MPTTRKETGRHRKYEHNKLLEATAAETFDGRPSLVLEDRLLDALKQHHFIRRGKIRARPLEPPAPQEPLEQKPPEQEPPEQENDRPGQG